MSARDRPGAAAAPSGWAAAIAVLLFVQILLGALVAGMKAGMGYNTWPLMDGQLIPRGSASCSRGAEPVRERDDGAVQPSRGGLRGGAGRGVAHVERAARVRRCACQGYGGCVAGRGCCRRARHLDAAGAGAAVAGAGASGRRRRAVRNCRLAPVRRSACVGNGGAERSRTCILRSIPDVPCSAMARPVTSPVTGDVSAHRPTPARHNSRNSMFLPDIRHHASDQC